MHLAFTWLVKLLMCVTEEPCSIGSTSSVTPSISHPAFLHPLRALCDFVRS